MHVSGGGSTPAGSFDASQKNFFITTADTRGGPIDSGNKDRGFYVYLVSFNFSFFSHKQHLMEE